MILELLKRISEGIPNSFTTIKIPGFCDLRVFTSKNGDKSVEVNKDAVQNRALCLYNQEKFNPKKPYDEVFIDLQTQGPFPVPLPKDAGSYLLVERYIEKNTNGPIKFRIVGTIDFSSQLFIANANSAETQ